MLEGRQPLSGACVVTMSPAVADELGLVEYRPGVIVIEVKSPILRWVMEISNKRAPA